MFPKRYLGIIPPYSVVKNEKREKKGESEKEKNKERIKRTNVPT
jgi:hypothetical protein